MASKTIMERLSRGEVLLLDGGTGSELQRRGVDTQSAMAGDKGTIHGLYPWGATGFGWNR